MPYLSVMQTFSIRDYSYIRKKDTFSICDS